MSKSKKTNFETLVAEIESLVNKFEVKNKDMKLKEILINRDMRDEIDINITISNKIHQDPTKIYEK